MILCFCSNEKDQKVDKHQEKWNDFLQQFYEYIDLLFQKTEEKIVMNFDLLKKKQPIKGMFPDFYWISRDEFAKVKSRYSFFDNKKIHSISVYH